MNLNVLFVLEDKQFVAKVREWYQSDYKIVKNC